MCLSTIMSDISHDSANRFLEREDVFDEPYSDINKSAFLDRFYAGKHQQVVKGINLIGLCYTDKKGLAVPELRYLSDIR